MFCPSCGTARAPEEISRLESILAGIIIELEVARNVIQDQGQEIWKLFQKCERLEKDIDAINERLKLLEELPKM